jgi:hypothetical protein
MLINIHKEACYINMDKYSPEVCRIIFLFPDSNTFATVYAITLETWWTFAAFSYFVL